jgi:plasmid stabilization system protein ParE
MNYRILPAAQQDLRHIDDWIAAQFGDAVADRAMKRIYDIFDLPPARSRTLHGRIHVAG